MRFLKQTLAICILVSIIYVSVLFSLPYIQPCFETVAIVSASMSFLQGGKAIVLNQQYAEDGEDDITVGDFTLDVQPPLPQSPQADTVAPTVIPEDAKELPPTPPIDKPANAGTIKRKTYSAGDTSVYIPLKSGYIKNCTTISREDIIETTKKLPQFTIAANGKPEVLIMHTHATESYQPTLLDWFSKEYNSRTIDNTKNMISVGDKIEAELKNAGIGVVHDKTLHDYPSYNGSYERSAVTVKRILQENPSIKVVLDVHRDAIQPDADNMIAPVTIINGKASAQVMIISGCDNGKMNMPNYMENLKLSALLQSTMESEFSGLSRPILFDYRKYNQDLTTGSILLEMGGHANTIDEAHYAGELVGKSLAKALLTLK